MTIKGLGDKNIEMQDQREHDNQSPMQSDEVTEVTDNNSDERSNSELQNSQTPSPPTPSASLAQNASALAMAAQLSASNNAQAAALGLGLTPLSLMHGLNSLNPQLNSTISSIINTQLQSQRTSVAEAQANMRRDIQHELQQRLQMSTSGLAPRPLPAFTTPMATGTGAPATPTPPSVASMSSIPSGGGENNMYSPPLADPQMMHAYAYKYGTAGRLHNPGHRKNATRENTAPLKKWLNDHLRNPYPTKGEKIILAIISHMTLTQVSTWFANARRRLKKENRMTWDRNQDGDDRSNDGNDADVNVERTCSRNGRTSTPDSSTTPGNNNNSTENSPVNRNSTPDNSQTRSQTSTRTLELPINPAVAQQQLLLNASHINSRLAAAYLAASQQQNLQQMFNAQIQANGQPHIWKLADMATKKTDSE